MTDHDFNEEQRLMVAVLRTQGCENPEAVVAAEPLVATVLGSAMLPALTRMLDLLSEAVRP